MFYGRTESPGATELHELHRSGVDRRQDAPTRALSPSALSPPSLTGSPTGLEAAVRADRIALGDRRYSPNRRLFAGAALRLAELDGIDIHLDGDQGLDVDFVAIQQQLWRVRGATGRDPIGQEARTSLEWFTDAFRRALMAEESADGRSPLSSCWLGHGLIEPRYGLRRIGRLRLRLFNAADLGHQAHVAMTWTPSWSVAVGARRSRRIITVIRERDPALLGERVRDLPRQIRAAGDDTDRRGWHHRLIGATQGQDVDGPSSAAVLSALVAARGCVAPGWGELWLSAGGPVDLGERRQVRVRCQLFGRGRSG